MDFADIKGNQHTKRGLEISAVGNHSVLLIGPSGEGKTMLAERLCTITGKSMPIEIIEDLPSRARFKLKVKLDTFQGIIIATMLPCPCGNLTHPTKNCDCTPPQIQRYINSVPNFILGRIDLQLEVAPIKYVQLTSKQKAETSAEIKCRVDKARQVKEPQELTEEASTLLKLAIGELSLSARAYDKIVKVAKTIARIDGIETGEIDMVDACHISEAVGYRSLDRNLWME